MGEYTQFSTLRMFDQLWKSTSENILVDFILTNEEVNKMCSAYESTIHILRLFIGNRVDFNPPGQIPLKVPNVDFFSKISF